MTNELKQLISIIRKSNNLRSDEKVLSLAQVLMAAKKVKCLDCAINKKNKTCLSGWHIPYELNKEECLQYVLGNWSEDLTKDLDQQSPETLSQLLKLLNNEQ